ncbi:hypothetical protein Zmor_024380 [Zophobas morio]|uniref:Uncharacterized protein n=1 Tax=Zophobas morio TaxID=2755281 RepID=A0AA38HYR7_9CUCU|nr:hypothetical protein Zmor_024380 [Zophobas morio]
MDAVGSRHYHKVTPGRALHVACLLSFQPPARKVDGGRWRVVITDGWSCAVYRNNSRDYFVIYRPGIIARTFVMVCCWVQWQWSAGCTMVLKRKGLFVDCCVHANC